MGLMAVGLATVFRLLYTKLPSFFDASGIVLMEWRDAKSSRPWFPRFLKSTIPLRVLIGSYFYADKKLVLTSMGIIADNSVTLLVSRRAMQAVH